MKRSPLEFHISNTFPQSLSQPCPKLLKVLVTQFPSFLIPNTALPHNANPPPGVLVECDPSIKAIILKIDQDKHDYIVEDLDDQTLMIKESQLQKLKARLEEV